MLTLSCSKSAKFVLFTTVFYFLLVLVLSKYENTEQLEQTTTTMDANAIVAQHCSGTLYPDLCRSTISTIPDLHTKSLPDIISSIVNKTAAQVRLVTGNCSAIERRRSLDIRQRRALDDCIELLENTLDGFSATISELNNASYHTNDIQTFLSAAMTNQYTCLDGFENVPGGGVRKLINDGIQHIDKLCSNSLAMSKMIPRKKLKKCGRNGGCGSRRETLEGYGKIRKDGFPEWISNNDRRLLQTSVDAIKADLVVAKDGRGNFTTVTAAVAAAPSKSKNRFVIYIKAGAYFENVELPKKMINIMFVGDGTEKTVIKGNRNVVDGWTTFRSATLAVVGTGFIAKGITVENYAGPSKHQAVALRSGSDLSAFYQCSFVGYQDTLYAHSLRQFYRECDIYGTVDFIFGNAAAVFQNCNLYARKPDPNQKNIYTAQGREDPNQNTGFAIQSCKVAAASDLIPVQSQFKTYLGRPWKEYSRTVFLQSQLDSVVDPAGWLEWNGNFALNTLYYGEYQNFGPGANTSGRVKWRGYRVITNATEANQFTVQNFIMGDQWLGKASIPFKAGLS